MSTPKNQQQSPLEQILGSLFDDMAKHGQIAGQALNEKDTIIADLIQALEMADVKLTLDPKAKLDPLLEKTLKLALISEAAATLINEPDMALNYKALFDGLPKQSDSKSEAHLEKTLAIRLLKLFMILAPTAPKSTLQQDAERTAKEILKGKTKKEQPDAVNAKNEVLDPLVETLKSLYGINPTVAGGISGIIQSVAMNYSAQRNWSQGGDGSQMADENTPEPGKEDPTGAELTDRKSV